MIPQPAIQEALDTALERSPDEVKARFSLLTSRGLEVRPGMSGGLNQDDESRLDAIQRQPCRLDTTAIHSLAKVLANQRHVEDAIGADSVLHPMAAQLDRLTDILLNSTGPHRDELARLVAEWTAYVGWLHTAVGDYRAAMTALKRAEEQADEIEDGIIASTSIGFQGYVSRLQQQPRKVIRASAASMATPGAHPTQQVYDILQSAESYAGLGDIKRARELLNEASDLATAAGEPPPMTYWYTEPFFRLNIGLAQVGIGEFTKAVDSLSSGIANVPADQRDADWMGEYRSAYEYAKERA
jgi:tetratricopeptide (TPR) repeat protein